MTHMFYNTFKYCEMISLTGNITYLSKMTRKQLIAGCLNFESFMRFTISRIRTLATKHIVYCL